MRERLRKNLYLAVAAAFFAIIFLSAPVFSQDDVSVTPRMNERRPVCITLTAEQKQKIEIIRAKYSAPLDDVKFDIQRKQLELILELRKEQPERAKIDRKIDEISRLHRKHEKLVLDEYFEIRTILTPAQNKLYVRKLVRTMVR